MPRRKYSSEGYPEEAYSPGERHSQFPEDESICDSCGYVGTIVDGECQRCGHRHSIHKMNPRQHETNKFTIEKLNKAREHVVEAKILFSDLAYPEDGCKVKKQQINTAEKFRKTLDDIIDDIGKYIHELYVEDRQYNKRRK